MVALLFLLLLYFLCVGKDHFVLDEDPRLNYGRAKSEPAEPQVNPELGLKRNVSSNDASSSFQWHLVPQDLAPVKPIENDPMSTRLYEQYMEVN